MQHLVLSWCNPTPLPWTHIKKPLSVDGVAECHTAILGSTVDTLAVHRTSTPKVQLVYYALAGLTSVSNDILISSELLGMGCIESGAARQKPSCKQHQYIPVESLPGPSKIS